jgi:hypothetical protein
MSDSATALASSDADQAVRQPLKLDVAVEKRSQSAALQALRMIWEQSETDDAAARAARQVNGCLEPGQRHWLGCLRSAS